MHSVMFGITYVLLTFCLMSVKGSNLPPDTYFHAHGSLILINDSISCSALSNLEFRICTPIHADIEVIPSRSGSCRACSAFLFYPCFRTISSEDQSRKPIIPRMTLPLLFHFIDMSCIMYPTFSMDCIR